MRIFLKLLTIIGLVIASVVTSLSFTVSPAAADGATDPHNCPTKIQWRALALAGYSPFFQMEGDDYMQKAVVHLIGKYCPGGKHHRKRYGAKFYQTKSDYCYVWYITSDDHVPYSEYDGTFYNMNTWEHNGGRNVNPPRFGVKDDESRQNCGIQHISSGVAAWLRCGHEIRTRTRVTIVKNGKDVDFTVPDRAWQMNCHTKKKGGDMTVLRDGKWFNP